MNELDADLDYLRTCLQQAPFTPHPWDGEDRNLGAFRSREELIAWYCQSPGVDGEPYRDRGFYTRELAMLSRTIRPRVVVEFGTSIGIGTCLLRWLNPEAELVTVDNANETFLPGDRRVLVGYMARRQSIDCEYVYDLSWQYRRLVSVGLCFIDACHEYLSVILDSERAWANKMPRGHKWAIAWHDHNDRHPGVQRAVAEFCASKGVVLQSRLDSDTVWVEGGT